MCFYEKTTPHLIELPDEEYSLLEGLVRDGRTQQRVARRARILLAMAHAQTGVQELADRLEIARNTIWYVCRRYEQSGIESIFDAPAGQAVGDFPLSNVWGLNN
jgi:Predicted DNA binding protein